MSETHEFDKRKIVDFGVILWSVVFILLEIEGGWTLFSWKSKKIYNTLGTGLFKNEKRYWDIVLAIRKLRAFH